MSDTSKDYVTRVISAAPFADNETGIPEMVSLIKALAAERDALQATVEDMRETLEEIASLTQTTNLLWWQEIAREALAKHKEQNSE